MVSDELLVQKVQSGDRQAFALLMLRHQGFVRRALYRFRCFQGHELEDACQEVFIKVYLALGSFRAESRFTTWVYRILTNYALERLRSRELQFSTLDNDQYLAESDLTEREDMRRDIQQAFGRISDQQKQVVYLCLMEGYSHSEVSRQHSMPLGTVKSHALRGRTQLQEVLKEWMPCNRINEESYCAVE